MDLTKLLPTAGGVRFSGRRRAAVVVALLIGLLAGCGTMAPSAGPSSPVPSSPAPAPAAGSATGVAPSSSDVAVPSPVTARTVVIRDYLFVPAVVSVPAGATVLVDNQDGSNHTLTAVDGSFDTGNIPGHAQGMFTAPSKPGSYPYKCAIHPFMKGTLTVT